MFAGKKKDEKVAVVEADAPPKKERAPYGSLPIVAGRQVLYHTVGGHVVPAIVTALRRDGSVDIKYMHRFNQMNVDVGLTEAVSYGVPMGEGPGTWSKPS